MKTALYPKHIALGAKMVTFSGWEMPLEYAGIIEEHLTVRRAVGLFDISHMGRVIIEGPDSEALLDYLSTNRIAGKPDHSVTYTAWCHADGGTIDDLLVYRHSSTLFSVVVNASNRQKDHTHIVTVARQYGFNVVVTDMYLTEGILALQGPNADLLAEKLLPGVSQIAPMHFKEMSDGQQTMIVSKTGYTGAGGFEIYLPSTMIQQLWDDLLAKGEEFGIVPIGLGARDTLRLEKGYALYGHELTDLIAPTESVCRWTVKWDGRDFIGKNALVRLEKSLERRIEHGVILIDPGVAREGYAVWCKDEQIGIVTSGLYSPSLQKSIAIILVQCDTVAIGDQVEIQIRKNRVKAEVVSLPFLTG